MYITQKNAVKRKAELFFFFFYHAQRASHPTHYGIQTNTTKKFSSLTHALPEQHITHFTFSIDKGVGNNRFQSHSLSAESQNAEGQCQCTITTEVLLQRFPISYVTKR